MLAQRLRALVMAGSVETVHIGLYELALLKCTVDGTITGEAATDVLYDLVDEGMKLYPKVYTRVQRKLRDLGD